MVVEHLLLLYKKYQKPGDESARGLHPCQVLGLLQSRH